MEIKVFTNQMMVVSKFSLDELKQVAKHRPDALKLLDKDGKPQFVVGASDVGTGSISKFGVEFAMTTNTDKKAALVVALPEDLEDKKEYIADEYGAILSKVDGIEKGLEDDIKSIKYDIAETKSSIEMID